MPSFAPLPGRSNRKDPEMTTQVHHKIRRRK
jgi:hypothetical protein